MKLAKLALLAALALAAGNAEAKHARSKASAADSSDCTKDSECVAVVDDCCPCSQGGKQRAIPKKEKAAYEKDRHKRCQGTACTEVMSQDASCEQKAFCGAGICELRDATAPSP